MNLKTIIRIHSWNKQVHLLIIMLTICIRAHSDFPFSNIIIYPDSTTLKHALERHSQQGIGMSKTVCDLHHFLKHPLQWGEWLHVWELLFILQLHWRSKLKWWPVIQPVFQRQLLQPLVATRFLGHPISKAPPFCFCPSHLVPYNKLEREAAQGS